MTRALILLSALMLLAAACSDDTGTSGSDSSSEPSDSAGSDGGDAADEDADGEDAGAADQSFDGETRILVIAPETDPLNGGRGEYPEVAAGARAAAAVLNADGGINGTEVIIESCDTKADANEAVNCAQRAVDDEFLAVVGGQDNSSNYADTLRDAGVPNVFPFAAPPLLSDPNSFVQLGSLSYLIGGLTGMITPEVETVGVGFIDSGPLGAQLESLSQAVTASHPGVSVNMIPISPNQGDYTPVVTAAAENDAVYLAMPSDAIVQFLQTGAQLGIDLPIGVPSVTVQGAALDQLGPDLSQGLATVAVYQASTTETNEDIDAFRTAMAEHEPDAFVTDLSANSYAGVMLIAEVLDGASEISPAALSEALNATDGLDLGLLPPIQFVEPSEVFAGFDITRVFNTSVLYVTVEDGDLVPSGSYVDMLTGE